MTGADLRRERREAGLTQDRFAVLLGLSLRQLRRLEAKRDVPLRTPMMHAVRAVLTNAERGPSLEAGR